MMMKLFNEKLICMLLEYLFMLINAAVHDNYKQLFEEFVSDRFAVGALYHDECDKIGVKSIIVVSYDERIADNREWCRGWIVIAVMYVIVEVEDKSSRRRMLWKQRTLSWLSSNYFPFYFNLKFTNESFLWYINSTWFYFFFKKMQGWRRVLLPSSFFLVTT